MKKRFLKSGSRDDYYYDFSYTRSNRNLTKDARDLLEDEDSDILDDIPNKVKCPLKHSWDNRYPSNAAKRWLKSKVGQPWNKNRQDFINFTDGRGEWMVEENTTMIDGVLHIQDYCGPRPIDNVRGDTFYVDQHGILKHKPKEKYKRSEYAYRFLIHEGFVWFRRDKNLFYCVNMTCVKRKEGYNSLRPWLRPMYANYEFNFNYYENSYYLPYPLKDGYVNKSDIKQAPKKAIPAEAYALGYLE